MYARALLSALIWKSSTAHISWVHFTSNRFNPLTFSTGPIIIFGPTCSHGADSKLSGLANRYCGAFSRSLARICLTFKGSLEDFEGLRGSFSPNRWDSPNERIIKDPWDKKSLKGIDSMERASNADQIVFLINIFRARFLILLISTELRRLASLKGWPMRRTKPKYISEDKTTTPFYWDSS